MKINKLNKKGDLTTTILVIGVILICAIGIVSFFYSTTKIRNSFVGIDLTATLNSQIEQKTFNHESTMGLYLEKNETQGFLFWQKDTTIFSVKYNAKP
ncbi:Uncharacterised protein [uncultured archaeon]|nr:Uncharacterised protein [uncultured archaeon]